MIFRARPQLVGVAPPSQATMKQCCNVAMMLDANVAALLALLDFWKNSSISFFVNLDCLLQLN